MQLNLHKRLQNLKMVAALANYIKTPGSLDSAFAVANSVKDGPLGEQALRHLLSDRHFKGLVDEKDGDRGELICKIYKPCRRAALDGATPIS